MVTPATRGPETFNVVSESINMTDVESKRMKSSGFAPDRFFHVFMKKCKSFDCKDQKFQNG